MLNILLLALFVTCVHACYCPPSTPSCTCPPAGGYNSYPTAPSYSSYQTGGYAPSGGYGGYAQPGGYGGFGGARTLGFGTPQTIIYNQPIPVPLAPQQPAFYPQQASPPLFIQSTYVSATQPQQPFYQPQIQPGIEIRPQAYPTGFAPAQNFNQVPQGFTGIRQIVPQQPIQRQPYIQQIQTPTYQTRPTITQSRVIQPYLPKGPIQVAPAAPYYNKINDGEVPERRINEIETEVVATTIAPIRPEPIPPVDDVFFEVDTTTTRAPEVVRTTPFVVEETEDEFFEEVDTTPITPEFVETTTQRTVETTNTSFEEEVEILDEDDVTQSPGDSTTRIVPIPRKKGDGKSDDYEYFYVYYDDKNGTNVGKDKDQNINTRTDTPKIEDDTDFDDNTNDEAKEQSIVDDGKVGDEVDGSDYNFEAVNAFRRNIKNPSSGLSSGRKETQKGNKAQNAKPAAKIETSAEYEEYEVEEFVPVNPDGSEGKPEVLRVITTTPKPYDVELNPYKRSDKLSVGAASSFRYPIQKDDVSITSDSLTSKTVKKVQVRGHRHVVDGQVSRTKKN